MLDTINTVAKSDNLLVFYCYDPTYGLSSPTMTIPMANFNHDLLKSPNDDGLATLFIFDNGKVKLTISGVNQDALPFSFYSYVVGAPSTVAEITDVNALINFFLLP